MSVTQIIALGERTNVGFVDEEFAPVDASLDRSSPETPEEVIQWRRAPDFLGSQSAGAFDNYKILMTICVSGPEISLFREGIDPGDILQGSLGDCWCGLD